MTAAPLFCPLPGTPLCIAKNRGVRFVSTATIGERTVPAPKRIGMDTYVDSHKAQRQQLDSPVFDGVDHSWSEGRPPDGSVNGTDQNGEGWSVHIQIQQTDPTTQMCELVGQIDRHGRLAYSTLREIVSSGEANQTV